MDSDRRCRHDSKWLVLHLAVGSLCLFGCTQPSAAPNVAIEPADERGLSPELTKEVHSLVAEVESLKASVAQLSQRLGRLEHKEVVASRPKGMLAAEGLQKRITLSFPRNTLEVALSMLSGEIGVPLQIRGSDLQLDGITKNQSLGLDEHDQPAEQVLLRILKRANPDGKLVYVLEKPPDEVERIVVTTRRAVARRGEALPAALRQQPAGPQAKP